MTPYLPATTVYSSASSTLEPSPFVVVSAGAVGVLSQLPQHINLSSLASTNTVATAAAVAAATVVASSAMVAAAPQQPAATSAPLQLPAEKSSSMPPQTVRSFASPPPLTSPFLRADVRQFPSSSTTATTIASATTAAKFRRSCGATLVRGRTTCDGCPRQRSSCGLAAPHDQQTCCCDGICLASSAKARGSSDRGTRCAPKGDGLRSKACTDCTSKASSSSSSSSSSTAKAHRDSTAKARPGDGQQQKETIARRERAHRRRRRRLGARRKRQWRNPMHLRLQYGKKQVIYVF